MARRKMAHLAEPNGRALAAAEELLHLYVGAMREIAREVEQAAGGWRARVIKVLANHGIEVKQKGKPCP